MPWHSPPHREFEGTNIFIITAACYLHHSIAGKTIDRITGFEEAILNTCQQANAKLHSWTILPNHYHLLASTAELARLRKLIGQLHGRTARTWNLEDKTPGRKVWFNFFDRDMKSDRHYWASVNYIHNNAVQHGLVEKWQDWPYSSAHQFLEELGRDEVLRIWSEYPVLDYGKDWDVY
jgi:putative transposase